MASLKVLSLFAIAGSVFSLNINSLNAQMSVGGGQTNDLSPAQEILKDMRQTNAPAIGVGGVQLLRFTDSLSFTPLEGLDRVFNWQPSQDKDASSAQTLGDRVEQFKLEQRRRIVSDSEIFEVINRIDNRIDLPNKYSN
ncbi:MAG: hypothetical protein WCQ26_00050 [Pseudanabaena sp. ELA748]